MSTLREPLVRSIDQLAPLLQLALPRAFDSSLEPAMKAGPAEVWMSDIHKNFGDTAANAGISVRFAPGEVHAVLGENGAGKSTLMNILFGLLKPDSGVIRLGDREVRFGSPADALKERISMVHQHFMLVPTLTVAENVAIGSRPSFAPRFRRSAVAEEVGDVASSYGLDVDPNALVRDLPVEVQQRVEIVRLLYRGARVLLLDEPTAALGTAQVGALLEIIDRLRDRGHTVVLTTHKFDEVLSIADRVTILRGGQDVASFSRPEFDRDAFTEAMFDTTKKPSSRVKLDSKPIGSSPVLTVSGLRIESANGGQALRGVNLRVHPGEIVGLAGVAGNGQSKLVQAIAGITDVESGTIELSGRDITDAKPLERHRLGLSVIPEDRQHSGLVLDMTIAENLVLAKVPSGDASTGGWLDRRSIASEARRLLEEYDVRPPDPTKTARQLSGGNQQKVVVARELSREPRLLVAASPTRGLDIFAAESVHAQLEAAARRGCGILVSSPDLDELLSVADRIVVILRGRIVLDIPIAEASTEVLGRAMTGQVQDAETDGNDPDV